MEISKYAIIKEIFNAMNLLKNSGKTQNEIIRKKILFLETRSEEILFNDFENLNIDRARYHLIKIKENSNKASEELNKNLSTRDSVLKTVSYLNEAIDAIRDLKNII